MNNRFAQAVLTAVTFVALLSTASTAKGQVSYLWNGTVDANLSTSGNWAVTDPPNNNTAILVFDSLGGGILPTYTLTHDAGFNGFQAYGFEFDDSTGVNGFTILNPGGANSFNIGVGGILIGSGTHSIASNFVLSASQSWINNSAGLFTASGTVNNNGNLLTVGGTGNMAISGAISGAGGLTKTGAGTLTLSAANSFTGNTSITGGVLSISNDNNLGTAPGAATPGKIVINGGTLRATSSTVINANRGIALGPTTGTGLGTIDVATATTLQYNGIIANNGGIGGFTKIGQGVLSLQGFSVSTFTGPINFNEGVVDYNGTGSRFGTLGQVTFNGGTLRYTGTSTSAGILTDSRPIAIGSNNGTIEVTVSTAQGLMQGTAGLNIGPNTLIKTGAGILAVARTVTGSGTIVVNQGTYRMRTNHNTIGNGISLDIRSGATFDMATFEDTVGSIEGAGNIIGAALTAGGSATNRLTTGSNDKSTLFSGTLSHTGGLTKLGAGTLTLSNNNTYSGNTLISGGTLVVNGTHTSTGTTTVSANGTLSGSGSLAGPVIVNGTLAPGTSPGTITVTNAVTMHNVSNFNVEVVGGSNTSDRLVSNSLQINGATLNISLFSGTLSLTDQFTIAQSTSAISGTFAGLPNTGLGGNVIGGFDLPLYLYYNAKVDVDGQTIIPSQGTLTLTPVPEPTTILAIGAVAFGAMGGIRRLRRRATASPALAV